MMSIAAATDRLKSKLQLNCQPADSCFPMASAVNYYSIRSEYKGPEKYVAQLDEVKLATEVDNKNQLLSKTISPCAELFDMLETSGILDTVPEQIIPSTPFPGPLSGKKYKIPILAVRDQPFIPLYVEHTEQDSSKRVWKRYLLDISSKDTIFTGPLTYLKLPHSPTTQWIILNGNLHLIFEAPTSMMSLNLLKLNVEYPEGLTKGTKTILADILYPKIYNFMEYLDLLNYTCEEPLRRVYTLVYAGNDIKLLALPHTWQRNDISDSSKNSHQEISNRQAALSIKRAFQTQLGRRLPDVKTQGQVKIDEYDLLDVDLPDEELKRLYDMMVHIRDYYERYGSSYDRLACRFYDMIMCIASRGFNEELVQQKDESIQSMVVRVFKSHLDYLPYVRTPSSATYYLPQEQESQLRTYHSRYKTTAMWIGFAPLNSLSEYVDGAFYEEYIYPQDVKSLLVITSGPAINLRHTYSIVEYNRSINLQDRWANRKKDIESWTKQDAGGFNLDSLINNYDLYGPGLPKDLHPLGLDMGGRGLELIQYAALSQVRVVINGIEFTREEFYIFRNTPVYDAIELTGETKIDFPLIRLTDIRLYKRFLNGELMLKYLYDNLSDTSFKVLSGDYSFLKYSELVRIRNMLDRHFILGMKFTDQLKLVKPKDELEEQLLSLLR